MDYSNSVLVSYSDHEYSFLLAKRGREAQWAQLEWNLQYLPNYNRSVDNYILFCWFLHQWHIIKQLNTQIQNWINENIIQTFYFSQISQIRPTVGGREERREIWRFFRLNHLFGSYHYYRVILKTGPYNSDNTKWKLLVIFLVIFFLSRQVSKVLHIEG